MITYKSKRKFKSSYVVYNMGLMKTHYYEFIIIRNEAEIRTSVGYFLLLKLQINKEK